MKAKKWRKVVREARARAVTDSADALLPSTRALTAQEFAIRSALYARARSIRGGSL